MRRAVLSAYNTLRCIFGRIEDAFREGLHEYLTGFLENTALLSKEIRDAYLSRHDRLLNP